MRVSTSKSETEVLCRNTWTAPFILGGVQTSQSLVCEAAEEQHEYYIPDYHGEEGTESEGKAQDLSIYSNLHLWSWGLGSDQKNEI